jgi:hypothetical protein
MCSDQGESNDIREVALSAAKEEGAAEEGE